MATGTARRPAAAQTAPAAAPAADSAEPTVEDRVTVRGIRARGRHGWYPEETAAGQDFVVDVALVLDTRIAAASDDLADTVDYGRLASDVAAIVSGEPVRLVETLAERIAALCLSDRRVRAAEVTVHKPQAPVPVPFADVTVTIRRSRS